MCQNCVALLLQKLVLPQTSIMLATTTKLLSLEVFLSLFVLGTREDYPGHCIFSISVGERLPWSVLNSGSFVYNQ